ncbi:hypothetical protein GCM10025759_25810 [Lysobacter panacisoli]|uniref:Uncharacterized protein n=1 Tax=Lysobacter panacisoli TaxID=1255263 RepID=A0ABP9LHF4_9GAMM
MRSAWAGIAAAKASSAKEKKAGIQVRAGRRLAATYGSDGLDPGVDREGDARAVRIVRAMRSTTDLNRDRRRS